MFTGPNIVRNGLILALDAGNTKSYVSGSSTWLDLSGNGNNVTLSGTPTYTNDNIHTLNFDETNDLGNVDNTSIMPTAAYTKVVWFRPETSTANIMSGGAARHAFWMASTSNTLRSGHNGAWSTVSYNAGDMLNKWWFGVVTFNTTTGWVLYLNGEQVDTSTDTATFDSGNNLRIASYNAGNFFDGDIPIAMLYNRVLDSGEVLQLFNSQKSRFGIN